MVALSGSQRKTDRTFIDLFVVDSDYPGKCRIIYSKDFEKHEGRLSLNRRVVFLPESRIVTCIRDIMESYDINKDVRIKANKLDGVAASMTVSREGEIYVGLWRSNKVIVFDCDLVKLNTITLSGIEDGGDSVEDITVMRDTLFVRTYPGFQALLYSKSGTELTELTSKNQTATWSIAVSSELVFVLWYPSYTLISVYLLVCLY